MIPNLFKKEAIPQIHNPDLLSAIDEVKNSKNKNEAIQKAYKLVSARFNPHRFSTFIFFWKAFENNPGKLWKRRGFMHCQQQNFLLRILLVKSGWFRDEDISLGFSTVWYISLHQYLKVKAAEDIIPLDPWNAAYGIGIGRYAAGFGSKDR